MSGPALARARCCHVVSLQLTITTPQRHVSKRPGNRCNSGTTMSSDFYASAVDAHPAEVPVDGSQQSSARAAPHGSPTPPRSSRGHARAGSGRPQPQLGRSLFSRHRSEPAQPARLRRAGSARCNRPARPGVGCQNSVHVLETADSWGRREFWRPQHFSAGLDACTVATDNASTHRRKRARWPCIRRATPPQGRAGALRAKRRGRESLRVARASKRHRPRRVGLTQ
jgi:hypothetical protein